MTLNIKQKLAYALIAGIMAATMLFGNTSASLLDTQYVPYTCANGFCNYP